MKIDSKNFDAKFKNILEKKEVDNIISGWFDLQNSKLDSKLNLIVGLFSISTKITNMTYKLLFWEDSLRMKDWLYRAKKSSQLVNAYKGEEDSGIIFIDDVSLDESFLRNLLTNHFNFELGIEPSLNIRLQICFNTEVGWVLLDIYDDRGLNIFYI